MFNICIYMFNYCSGYSFFGKIVNVSEVSHHSKFMLMLSRKKFDILYINLVLWGHEQHGNVTALKQ